MVANVTATSDELIDALKARAPASFTLVIPATPFGGGREAAFGKLAEALEQLRAAGLEAEGGVGNADPILAVTDAPVTHVVSQPPKPEHEVAPPPPARSDSAMGPLAVLAWGGRKPT